MFLALPNFRDFLSFELLPPLRLDNPFSPIERSSLLPFLNYRLEFGSTELIGEIALSIALETLDFWSSVSSHLASTISLKELLGPPLP